MIYKTLRIFLTKASLQNNNMAKKINDIRVNNDLQNIAHIPNESKFTK